jgi:hypothetical protein
MNGNHGLSSIFELSAKCADAKQAVLTITHGDDQIGAYQVAGQSESHKEHGRYCTMRVVVT